MEFNLNKVLVVVLSAEGRLWDLTVSPLSGISGLSLTLVTATQSVSLIPQISSLALLPSPVALLLLAHSPDFFFPKLPFSEREALLCGSYF